MQSISQNEPQKTIEAKQDTTNHRENDIIFKNLEISAPEINNNSKEQDLLLRASSPPNGLSIGLCVI